MRLPIATSSLTAVTLAYHGMTCQGYTPNDITSNVRTAANASTATTRKLRGHLERSIREAAAALEERHRDIGARIAAARKAKSWKQKELAAAVHVEPTTVSRWETGAHIPDLTTLNKIAEVLDLTVRDLLPDVSPQPSELAELRDEVRDLRESVVEVLERLDRLLAERDRPNPGTLYKPEEFGGGRASRSRSE